MSRLLVTPYSLFAILVSAAVVLAWQGPAVGPVVVRKPAKPQAAAVPELADGVIPLSELSATKTTSQATDDATERKLQDVVDVDFKNEKLRDVLKKLSRDGKRFPLVVDDRALNDAQISLDKRQSLRLKGRAIEHALRRVLEPQGLTWTIQNGAVHVTTNETEFYFVRAYDLEGLQSPEASRQLRNRTARTAAGRAELPFQKGTEFDWVLDAVQWNMSGVWAGRDGVGGTLVTINNTLIVSQTFRTHREISELLRALRLAAQGKLHAAAFALRHRHYPYRRDADIRRKLTKPATLRLKEIPLNKALSQIERTLGVSFWEDRRSLDDAQIAADVNVSLLPDGATWREAIEAMLKSAGIGFLVEDGAIRLLPEGATGEQRLSFLFDIRDLMRIGFSTRSIEGLIRSQSGGLWQSDGDPTAGSLSVNPDLGVVIVSQTPAVNQSIAELLQNLRANLKNSLKSTGGKLVLPKYLDRVELRYYSVDDGDKAKELAAAIPVFVEPSAWKAGRFTPAIKVVEGTLIVRQTVNVHQAIQAFLRELDPAVPPNGGLGGLGGGLGGGGFF
jgi:hypothetical protein